MTTIKHAKSMGETAKGNGCTCRVHMHARIATYMRQLTNHVVAVVNLIIIIM